MEEHKLDISGLAGLDRIEIRAGMLVEGFLAGIHRSPRKGNCPEFREFRDYRAGDSIRDIDWRASGRSDRLQLRIRDDETDLKCRIVLDVSRSLDYKGKKAAMSKWEYARTLAAALILLLQHQGDAAGLTGQSGEAYGDTTGRRNGLHIMSRERIGQRRGVPLLAPVLESLKQLGRYTDAEITAAVISAMFTVFVKSQNPSDGRPFGEMIPAEELIDNADQSSIELGPGAIIDLNPGEEVQFADPKHPNTGYDDFTNATIRLIGAGLEIPPEVMMKQFTTSYSAARGALNEFWRTCSMQRDWFTDDFCQPVYEEWFAEAVARGRIHALGFFTDPARRKAYTACAWNGPARTNLNPVQEVDAAIKRVDAGFSTAQEETAQMTGGDYNRNIKLHMTEAKRKREVDEIGKAQTAGE